MTSSSIAFFSYAHRDNDNSNGRLLQIAEDLRGEYAIQTGEELRLFVDKDDELDGLKWGDEWSKVIDSKLGITAFYIPVISPSFLASDECRREFLTFRGTAVAAGDTRLILPLLFADLRRTDDDDEVASITRKLHWIDWTTARLEDRLSPESKKLVQKMAKRLLEAQEEIDSAPKGGGVKAPSGDSAATSEEDEGDDSPGLVDRVAAAESAIEVYAPRLAAFTNELSVVTRAFNEASPRLEEATSFGRRLKILHETAVAISPNIESSYQIGQSLSETVVEADPGVRDLLELAEEAASSENQLERQAVSSFADTIIEAMESALTMIESARDLDPTLAKMQGLSREMRPLVRRLRKALSLIVDAQTVFGGWLTAARKVKQMLEVAATDNGRHDCPVQ